VPAQTFLGCRPRVQKLPFTRELFFLVGLQIPIAEFTLAFGARPKLIALALAPSGCTLYLLETSKVFETFKVWQKDAAPILNAIPRHKKSPFEKRPLVNRF